MEVIIIIVWLLYVICMVAIIYKTVKETRAIKTRRQVIDKACNYLYEWNMQQAIKYGARDILSVTEYTINVQDFRKAMEED